MKSTLKFSIVILCQILFTSRICAQGVTTTASDVPKLEGSFSTKPTVSQAPLGKEVTITIKNTAEKPVAIFAGPKEGIRDPKVKMLGGLSLNKLYLKENEIVCLVSNDLKPMACTVIKPGNTSVEVNSSGTTISSK